MAVHPERQEVSMHRYRSLVAGSLALIMLATLGIGATARAATFKGVDFPDAVTIGGQECRLNGTGVRTKYFIYIYLGALYLSQPSQDAAAVIAADEPKRLVMHFVYSSVDAATLKKTWEEGFSNNTAPADLAKLKDRVDQLLACFVEDMVKGDTIVITYLPGQGTEVAIKGKVAATLEGADFMKALFAIWLGDKPADSGLKKSLLGKK
jgi:hypothetical protein